MIFKLGDINQNLIINLFLSLGSVMLFRLISLSSGLIGNQGLGYDGLFYAKMMTEGLNAGTANTQLRPFLILLTRICYYFSHDVVNSFVVMNYIYAFSLSFSLCCILEYYTTKLYAKAFYIFSIFSCIATTKMFAFYPALIDLGAYALISITLYLILINQKRLAGIACLLAVLSREFSIVLVFFAICRDIRTGSWSRNTLFTYAPSLLMFVILRAWVSSTNKVSDTQAISIFDLANNAAKYCLDPVFISFFLYFTLTVFGGITMILWSQPQLCLKYLREEYEYSIFLTLIVGISLTGNLDTWRYLAYSIPVVTMLFARYSNNFKFWQQLPIFLVSATGTVLTQQPFTSMDMDKYFSSWFPLFWFYQEKTLTTEGLIRPVNLELTWISLFIIAFFGLVLLAKLHRRSKTGSV